MIKWTRSFLRALLITGSPTLAWRVGRPYLGRDMPWLRRLWRALPILALFALLLPTPSLAQCNGVFQPHTFCGNNGSVPAIPSAIPATAIAVTPVSAGGNTGQIQWNNSSSLAGFTASQDCTITPSPNGVVNCTRLQNVAVTTTGASTNDVMAYNGSGWLHFALITVLNAACTVSPTSCSAVLGYASVKWYGAACDGATDDTTSFQNAWNAAKGTSGFGKIFIPATSTSCLVTKINGTNSNNVVVFGVGDQSVIKINGSDSNGNWWDLSGSNNISFERLRFVDNGSTQAIIFLWAWTNSFGVLSGLSFDHVNAVWKHNHAGLFAYGYGCAANCAANISSGSLSISNSSWKNTANGAVPPSSRTANAVVSLSAYNNGSFASTYVTVPTITAIAARTHFYNFDIIDFVASTPLSNNAAIIMDGTNQFISDGGSYQCQCDSDIVMWTSTEGVVMNMPAMQAPVITGDGCTVNNWIKMGGGFNGSMHFNTPFWSCPNSTYIALDQGVSASGGGMGLIYVTGNDPGLNTHGAPFIGKTAAGCGSFAAANNWLHDVNIQLLTGANNIVTCGSIDAHSAFWNVGTVTLPGGATDLSHHF